MNALLSSTKLSILLLLWVTPLVAQYEMQSGTAPAAKSPQYDIGAGFTHVTMNLAGKPTVNLTGAVLSTTIDVSPRWAATVDSSYARGPRDAGSGHGSYLLNVLAGPVFVPAQTENTRLLVRVLAGVSLVDGAVPVNQLYYRGWLTRFSWAAGAGIERNLSGPLAVRFNVDYLRTRFVSTTAFVQPQNDIRVSGLLVFRFAVRRQASHIALRQP